MSTVTVVSPRSLEICARCQHWLDRPAPPTCRCECHLAVSAEASDTT